MSRTKQKTEKLVELTKTIDQFITQVDQLNDLIFKMVVSSLFEEHPTLKKFSFTGYTPTFNDGEECTFTLGLDYPTVNADEDGDEDQEDSNDNQVLRDAVTQYLRVLPDEFYSSHFKNNFEVTVTRDNVTVSKYDCGY